MGMSTAAVSTVTQSDRKPSQQQNPISPHSSTRGGAFPSVMNKGCMSLLYPHPAGGTEQMDRNLVVAVVRGCAAAFVFIHVFIVVFLRTTHRRWMWRDESHGGEWIAFLPSLYGSPYCLQPPL